MKKIRILSVLLAASILSAAVPTIHAEEIDAKDYTYEITPILEGFNRCYFVKTDNPDPNTFTFVDKDTKYYEGECLLSRWTYECADVIYEDVSTLRVDGGYIFSGLDSDGGTLTLKINNHPYRYNSSWEDTGITYEVPEAVDHIDYLINTYAVHDDFFENMSAIQSGLNNISRYSGSNIRGNLYKVPDEYWGVTARTHIDQLFYIYSPYARTDEKVLFATYIYPYCCDSLGFPSILSRAAKRMEPTAEVQWNGYNHSMIEVTFNEQTYYFGGQGNGEGTEISEDKIKKYFHFGGANDTVKLADARQLLVDYAAVEMDDDIPSEGRLTWKQVADTAGSGSWAKVVNGYSYFYKKDSGDEEYYDADDFGAGNSIYWGGSLGFGSGTWVDGRYIDITEVFQPGVKFEDYPEADVILYNALIPKLSFDCEFGYDVQAGHYDYIYSNIEITYKVQTAKLFYDESYGYWTTNLDNSYYWDKLIEKGLIDSSYLDCIRYTADDLKTIGVDRNTDIEPEYGYIYDQTVEPGTPFGTFSGTSAEVKGDFLVINKKGGTQVLRLSTMKPEMIDALSDDIDTLSHYINATVSDTSSDCVELSEAQLKAIEYVLAADYN